MGNNNKISINEIQSIMCLLIWRIKFFWYITTIDNTFSISYKRRTSEMKDYTGGSYLTGINSVHP